MVKKRCFKNGLHFLVPPQTLETFKLATDGTCMSSDPVEQELPDEEGNASSVTPMVVSTPSPTSYNNALINNMLKTLHCLWTSTFWRILLTVEEMTATIETCKWHAVLKFTQSKPHNEKIRELVNFQWGA